MGRKNNSHRLSNSNLSSWTGVERPSDFGANFVQHFIKGYLTIFTIWGGALKTRRDKNIVPLAHIKTHLSRWVFVFISWEQWNESASQILEMTYRSWNSLTRMKCTAVHKDSFYFTICGAYHFKFAKRIFHSSLPFHIKFVPSWPKSPLILRSHLQRLQSQSL